MSALTAPIVRRGITGLANGMSRASALRVEGRPSCDAAVEVMILVGMSAVGGGAQVEMRVVAGHGDGRRGLSNGTRGAPGLCPAGSAQPRSPAVPIGSRRMAATGVTATAIVFMASSFDGRPLRADESPPE